MTSDVNEGSRQSDIRLAAASPAQQPSAQRLDCSADIQEAARRILAGGLVIYPTETFFGIGCRVDAPEALQRVFATKRRSPDMPLPVILGSVEQLPLVADIPAAMLGDVEKIAEFWPAPLTILLPAVHALPDILTGGTGRIAVRVSAHPAARALSQACGLPIVSSSANISGRPAVTSATELDPELIAFLGSDDMPDGILDMPPAPGGGMASTIVEPLGQRQLRIRREGALPLSQLIKAGFTFLS